MPIPTPFHPRTQALCHSYRWKDWSGYCAVCAFDTHLDREYNAIRQGAALLDVTPLFKYDITGSEAADLLAFVLVRDVRALKPGRVTYVCWCDGHGWVLDDGTCARLADDHFRLTAAAPSYHWLARHAVGFDVAIRDTTAELAALALQGPTSREVLRQVADVDADRLRFFGLAPTRFEGGLSGWVTRTGYTGDLGYELWVENAHALPLWDALMARGTPYGLEPIGLDALDVARIEAGFIMQGVDYTSAHHALTDRQRSTPYELGLGWTVQLEREPFIGQSALQQEHLRGSRWALVGLEIDWEALERAYDACGLPPRLPVGAWRTPVPVYRGRRQVGRATSGAWSPILKRNLALATVEAAWQAPGTRLDIEITVEWERRTVPCTVRETPFFDPPRKKAR